MSVHLARAQLLLQQSRPAEAEAEAAFAITELPGNSQPYALLALSRLGQDKFREALDAAQAALQLGPGEAGLHYILGLVHHRSGQNSKALIAAHEAIRLEPGDADNFCLLASIQLGLAHWQEALDAAEQSLALHPENTSAANLRAMALIRLGRKAEAVNTVDFALQRDPENALSHANQGWNLLHQNNPKAAAEHFREALRLDPGLDYAREGMLEALKARNPLYRGMLAYFLWMGRLSDRYQWAIIIGIYFCSRVLIGAAQSSPQFAPLWWVLLSAFYGFVYLTWTARPMFNLFLRLDSFGRHVLSPEQRTATNWFGPVFVAALASTVWFFVTQSDAAFLCMFYLAALSICVAVTFMRRGKARLGLGLATLTLAGLAALIVVPLLIYGKTTTSLLGYFALGFIAFQILANALR